MSIMLIISPAAALNLAIEEVYVEVIRKEFFKGDLLSEEALIRHDIVEGPMDAGVVPFSIPLKAVKVASLCPAQRTLVALQPVPCV